MTTPSQLLLLRARRRPMNYGRVLLVFALAAISWAAEAPRRAIDLPADSLEQSLKRLSTQAGVQIIFSPELTDGIRTKSLKGEFTVVEAANRLLAGTHLYLVNDERS